MPPLRELPAPAVDSYSIPPSLASLASLAKQPLSRRTGQKPKAFPHLSQDAHEQRGGIEVVRWRRLEKGVWELAGQLGLEFAVSGVLR